MKTLPRLAKNATRLPGKLRTISWNRVTEFFKLIAMWDVLPPKLLRILAASTSLEQKFVQIIDQYPSVARLTAVTAVSAIHLLTAEDLQTALLQDVDEEFAAVEVTEVDEYTPPETSPSLLENAPEKSSSSSPSPAEAPSSRSSSSMPSGSGSHSGSGLNIPMPPPPIQE